jgi:hypothetical protein
MTRLLVKANESTAARRRVYFDLRDAADGMTPETGEADGQPQISTNGGAWTDSGIGALTHIGHGRYYTDLTQATVASAGDLIETRYKSVATAESPGDSMQVIGFDPAAALSTFDASSDTVDIGAVAGSSVSGIDDFQVDVSGLSTFDHETDMVLTAGGTFWSTAEQRQIRQRLGIDGDKSQPSGGGDMADIKTLLQTGGAR